ncbi:MAG TPA: hypothetical protein VIN57_04980, partial [Magnetovibrio sp.]
HEGGENKPHQHTGNDHPLTKFSKFVTSTHGQNPYSFNIPGRAGGFARLAATPQSCPEQDKKATIQWD